MLPCSLITCAMMFLQTTRDQAETLEQVRPRGGSDDVSWISTAQPKAAMHIRGPMWSRGLSLHRTASKSVWMVPGPSARGTTVGLGVTVDF